MKLAFLTAILSLFALCAIAQPANKIPASVLPLLDKAEYYRASFKHDSSVLTLQAAQAAYKNLGMEYEAACLYTNICVYSQECQILDSVFFNQQVEQFNQIRLQKYPQDKWLERRYMLAAWFVHFKYHNKPKFEALHKQMAAVTEAEDWEIRFMYLIDEFVEDEPSTHTYLLQAKDIWDKHCSRIDPKKSYYTHIFFFRGWNFFNNLGKYYLYLKDYERALEYKIRTIKFLESHPYLDSVYYSTSFNRIASLYRKKNDFSKAQEYYEKALRFSPLHVEYSFVHYNGNLASVLFYTENYKQVIKYAKIALQNNQNNHLFKASEDFINTTEILILKSYSLLKRFSDAQPYAESLQAYAETHRDFESFAALGFFYHKQQQFARAKEYYSRAEKLFTQDYPKEPLPRFMGESLAEFAYDQAQYLQSLSLYQKLLVRNCQNFSPTSDLSCPKLEQVQDWFQSLRVTVKKLACIKKAYIDQGNLSVVAEYRQNAMFAIELLKLLRNSVERENSKTTLLNLSFQAYEHAVRAELLSQNAYRQGESLQLGAEAQERVYQLLEDSKAFLLSSALQEQRARQFGDIPTELVEKEKELLHNLQFYTQQQRATKDEQAKKLYADYAFDFSLRLDSLKRSLELQYPSYYQLKYADNLQSLSTIQKTLAKNQLILSYLEGTEDIFLLAISQKELKAYPIAKPENYNRLIGDYRKMLTDVRQEYNISQFVELSAILYKLLIPFEIGAETERLLIVPDGSLYYIPFETLIKQEPQAKNGQNYANLDYLLTQKSLSYQYSLNLWAGLQQKQIAKEPARILAFAAAYENLPAASLAKIPEHLRNLRKTLTPLSGTVEELRNLEQQYAGTYLYSKEATELNFKTLAPQYRIIHLAMHGLVDEESPEFSSLAFTEYQPEGEKKEDNFLQSYEIKAAILNADLVVLSACETGYGKYERGEGTISIGRSFFYNGTSSLLMTLWSINDASTPTLIYHFYDGMQQGKDKDEALRYAKLQYLTQARGQAAHPAYWAAFVQMGNTLPLQIATQTGYFWYYALGAGAISLLLGWVALRRRSER